MIGNMYRKSLWNKVKKQDLKLKILDIGAAGESAPIWKNNHGVCEFITVDPFAPLGTVDIPYGLDSGELERELYQTDNPYCSSLYSPNIEYLKTKYNDKIGKELSDRFSKIVLKEILHAKFVDGAINFLKYNHKSFDFYIASATPHDELIKITNYQKIDQYFKKIYGYPPDKETIIKTIIKENNYKTSEVIMLGDAISDFKAAKMNKIKFIGISIASRLINSNQNSNCARRCFFCNFI